MFFESTLVKTQHKASMIRKNNNFLPSHMVGGDTLFALWLGLCNGKLHVVIFSGIMVVNIKKL